MLAQARCSGRVPLVTAVLGASAGHGALVAPISDFSVMSAQGPIFTAGPPVVHESLGETISKEDLGGPDVAIASGLIHNLVDDDTVALDLVRRYLLTSPPRHGRIHRTPRVTTTRHAWWPRSSTSCRATAGASTTCARSSTSSSTQDRRSRCNRDSVGR